MELTGIHHLTAVTADVRQNYHFYTQTLGMRLVKRTVNQDDVSAYHLFYADGDNVPLIECLPLPIGGSDLISGEHTMPDSAKAIDAFRDYDWTLYSHSALYLAPSNRMHKWYRAVFEHVADTPMR